MDPPVVADELREHKQSTGPDKRAYVLVTTDKCVHLPKSNQASSKQE